MKSLAIPTSLPAAVAALERAFSAGGASSLDPTVPAAVWRRALGGPAAEFLSRPGKQLRRTIVQAGWTLGGGDPTAMPEKLALVIELLHAGSLIVDDVEDDSLERRGAPALHRLIGVPLAINTGSWMYFWALAELAALDLPATAELAAHRAVCGTLVRCHQGQALDLAVKVAELELADVGAVVAAATRLKTGALCAFAAELGAIAAGASVETRAAIATFGTAMGSGLQMLDDLGALTSPMRHDKAREDLLAGRATWPWAWVAEHRPFAWARLAALERTLSSGRAGIDVDLLVDELAGELVAAVGAIGRARVRATLDDALAELIRAVGASAVTEMIAAELRRMEDSYG